MMKRIFSMLFVISLFCLISVPAVASSGLEDPVVAEALKFFEEAPQNRGVPFATVDGDQPRIRYLTFLFVRDGKIWFLTSDGKKVGQQLMKNPKAAFVGMPSGLKQIRVEGSGGVSKDPEVMEAAAKIYRGVKADDPTALLFYIDKGTVTIWERGKPTQEIEF